MNYNLNQSRVSVSTRGIFSLLFVLGLMSAVVPAFAGEPKDRPERGPGAAEHMKHMAQELGLTDAQKDQVKTIMQAQKTKMETLRDNDSLERREKMQQMRAMREAAQKEIRAVLTPEQQAKFDAMPRPEPGQRRPEGGKRPE